MNMNADICNQKNRIINLLQEVLSQLIQYNSIEVDNLKLLCYTLYNEYITESNKDILNLIITIFSYINQETNVYNNNLDQYEMDFDNIFNSYINNSIQEVFEGNK